MPQRKNRSISKWTYWEGFPCYGWHHKVNFLPQPTTLSTWHRQNSFLQSRWPRESSTQISVCLPPPLQLLTIRTPTSFWYGPWWPILILSCPPCQFIMWYLGNIVRSEVLNVKTAHGALLGFLLLAVAIWNCGCTLCGSRGLTMCSAVVSLGASFIILNHS